MDGHRKILPNLGITLGSIIVMLLILEVALRVYFADFADEAQYLKYMAPPQAIEDHTARINGLPFVNYGLTTTYPDHNSLGYRGREISLAKPAGTFRIVALGGSTTYGEFISKAENAYPAQLESILREQYGYQNVEVINGGVLGYSSWEIYSNFSFRVLGLDPDLIIYYEAINDVWPRLADPAWYDGLYSGRGIWHTDLAHQSPSVLYRYIAVRMGWTVDPTTIESHLRAPEGFRSCIVVVQNEHDFCENLGTTPQAILSENPPIYLERNLRNLVAVAQANDVAVMFSSWAYSTEEFYEASGDFVTHAFMQGAIAEHNAIVEDIASEMHTLFYDFAANLPARRGWWVDGYHFNVQGAREQARQYARFLHQQRIIPRARLFG